MKHTMLLFFWNYLTIAWFPDFLIGVGQLVHLSSTHCCAST